MGGRCAIAPQGKNMLGKIFMEVRDKFRTASKKTSVISLNQLQATGVKVQ
jgi:hypothetical protein